MKQFISLYKFLVIVFITWFYPLIDKSAYVTSLVIYDCDCFKNTVIFNAFYGVGMFKLILNSCYLNVTFANLIIISENSKKNVFPKVLNNVKFFFSTNIFCKVLKV